MDLTMCRASESTRRASGRYPGRPADHRPDPLVDGAFDPYSFVQNAWLQRREYTVRDGHVAPEEIPDNVGAEPRAQ